MGKDGDTGINICSSFPRIFTTQIQCSFGTYFWEMYTQEFGWTAAEYGKVQSLFNFTQFFAFIILGLIYYGIDKALNDDGVIPKGTKQVKVDKETVKTGTIDKSNKLATSASGEITVTLTKQVSKIDIKIKLISSIEVIAAFVHSLSFFFLILLPIRWHQVPTSHVEHIFGKESNFLYSMFKGPVNFSRLSSNSDDVTAMDILRIIIELFYIPCRLVWILLYPFMKLFWMLIDSFAPIESKSNTIASSLPTIVPSTILDLPPKPLPQFTGRFNTPRMNAWKRFMGTRAFKVYFLVIVHGIAMSAFELCTQALPTYVYDPDNSNAPTALSKSAHDAASHPETKADFIGAMINVNMMFFTVANLFVIWLFSFVRYYVHGSARLANTFLLMSSSYMIGQIPFLNAFISFTKNAAADYVTINPGSLSDNTATGTAGGNNRHKAKSATLDNTTKRVKLVCLTIFHSTVFFWIFTGGPLTFYVSANILDGHDGIRAFGVPAILVGFAGAMVVIGIYVISGDPNSVASGWDDPGKPNSTAPNTTPGQPPTGQNMSRWYILILCILTQSFTLLFFLPFDYSWNKSKWLNYIILIMTGVVNTLFLSYTYVCMGLSIGLKCWKMLIYGPFYAIMGLNVSKAMGVMFQSFGADEIRNFNLGGDGFNYHYCFPTVYKAITSVFMIANTICVVLIGYI